MSDLTTQLQTAIEAYMWGYGSGEDGDKDCDRLRHSYFPEGLAESLADVVDDYLAAPVSAQENTNHE